MSKIDTERALLMSLILPLNIFFNTDFIHIWFITMYLPENVSKQIGRSNEH